MRPRSIVRRNHSFFPQNDQSCFFVCNQGIKGEEKNEKKKEEWDREEEEITQYYPEQKRQNRFFFLPFIEREAFLFTPYSCDYEPAIKGTTAISNCMIVSRILTLGFPSIVRFFFTMMTHRANSSRSRESRAKLRLRLLHFPPPLD